MSFVIYSRPFCGLCEEMVAGLLAMPAVAGVPVRVVDVDADPVTRARFGHKIPVLMFAGELVCHGHLDGAEVHKALKLKLRPV